LSFKVCSPSLVLVALLPRARKKCSLECALLPSFAFAVASLLGARESKSAECSSRAKPPIGGRHVDFFVVATKDLQKRQKRDVQCPMPDLHAAASAVQFDTPFLNRQQTTDKPTEHALKRPSHALPSDLWEKIPVPGTLWKLGGASERASERAGLTRADKDIVLLTSRVGVGRCGKVTGAGVPLSRLTGSAGQQGGKRQPCYEHTIQDSQRGQLMIHTPKTKHQIWRQRQAQA
jgi:hypothetical protein